MGMRNRQRTHTNSREVLDRFAVQNPCTYPELRAEQDDRTKATRKARADVRHLPSIWDDTRGDVLALGPW